jgi:phospholipase/carboxylesterase
MGEAAQAARFLEACYRAGFDDATAPSKDPDFEKVRDAEPFKAALERIERWTTAKARAGGRRIAVKAEYLAEVRVVEPEGEREPHERLPLVVGLHGFGDNAANFAGLFLGRRVAQPFLFAVVETPYPFLSSSRGVGYSWELEGVPGASASASLSADLVLRAIEAVKREWRVDERRVFLLGFSQGAGLAYRVGLANPHLFAGVIPVGGWLDAGEHPEARMAAAKATRFLVCHSEEDRMVPFAAATAAVAELARFAVPHDLVRYAGGHSLPEDLVRRIAAWVADPAGAPKEPQPQPAK